MKITGKFSKVATTNNSIVIGTTGNLTPDRLTYDVIINIAKFYGIDTSPDKFGWHLITAEGAVKRGCKLPISNYNEFIEFFTSF